MGDGFTHPYVPNAAPEPRRKLLDAIGVGDVAELYAAIPEALRVKGLLDLPPALPGEQDLRRHLEEIVARNQPCTGSWLNFCGAGCAQHYVPAIVDEIVHRGEFLTAYGGGTYSDHGKNQALFEFQSLIGELVGMEVVSTPTYDAGAATGSAVTMACRITGRRGVLVPETMSADKRSQLQGFAKPFATIETVARDPATGCTDLADLRAKVSAETAAVVIESPGYLGPIETQAQTTADIVHEAGAMLIVGVDPVSLGVLAAPADYGADLVVGDLQPLGIHMYAGGGNGGFIASRDEARFVAEYPTIMFSIAPAVEGEASASPGPPWSARPTTPATTPPTTPARPSGSGPSGLRSISRSWARRALLSSAVASCSAPATRRSGSRGCPASRCRTWGSRSSRSSWWTSPARARPSPPSTGRCWRPRSTAART